MASNQDRLLCVTHYVIKRCDPAKLGATKLNKVLWFADVIYYRRHGRTITASDNYVKQQFGPVQRNRPRCLGKRPEMSWPCQRANCDNRTHADRPASRQVGSASPNFRVFLHDASGCTR